MQFENHVQFRKTEGKSQRFTKVIAKNIQNTLKILILANNMYLAYPLE